VPGGGIFLHRPTGLMDNRVDPPVLGTVLPIWYYPPTLSGPSNYNNAHLFIEEPPGDFHGLAYGNGVCVGVGVAGWILRSEDLQAWEFINVPELPALTDVAFGDGNFVATGPAGAVFYSADGVEWAETSLGVSENLKSVTH